MSKTLEAAKELEPQLIELRRDFHSHPEIAFEEVRTGQRVATFCNELGLAVKVGAAKTGVIAELNPGKARTLALRADMDALPIQEENEISYRSTIEGKGHLCGHDAHTSMLMGAAKILTASKEELPFTVRFIFQPAEEVPQGGASKLIAEGYLDGVEEIFGLHVNPLLPTGTLGLHSGATMASMDRFVITVEGVGGHGAMPHHARDPLLTAAEVVMGLQSIVARRIDPLEQAVISVCQINSGNAFNVIPARAEIVGTARSLSAGIRDNLELWIEQIASGITKAHGLNASCEYERGTPVLINHEHSTDKLGAAFKQLGGTDTDIRPTMGGEDFAFYLERIPGTFGFLGAGDGTDQTAQCFHHPRYNIDEKALAWGSALLAEVALSWGKEEA